MTRINGTLHEDQHIFFLSYLTHFFIEWEIFQTEVAEKGRTRVLCSTSFLRKSCRLRNVEKYCRVGQATNDNTRWSLRIEWWIRKVKNTQSM